MSDNKENHHNTDVMSLKYYSIHQINKRKGCNEYINAHITL